MFVELSGQTWEKNGARAGKGCVCALFTGYEVCRRKDGAVRCYADPFDQGLCHGSTWLDRQTCIRASENIRKLSSASLYKAFAACGVVLSAPTPLKVNTKNDNSIEGTRRAHEICTIQKPGSLVIMTDPAYTNRCCECVLSTQNDSLSTPCDSP